MCDCGCSTTTFETEGTVAADFELSVPDHTDPSAGWISDASGVIPAGQPGGPALFGTGDGAEDGSSVVDPSVPAGPFVDPTGTGATSVGDALRADASVIGGGTVELSTPMALAGLMDLPGVDATDKATLAGIINANLSVNDRILAPSHDIYGNSL